MIGGKPSHKFSSVGFIDFASVESELRGMGVSDVSFIAAGSATQGAARSRSAATKPFPQREQWCSQKTCVSLWLAASNFTNSETRTLMLPLR